MGLDSTTENGAPGRKVTANGQWAYQSFRLFCFLLAAQLARGADLNKSNELTIERQIKIIASLEGNLE